MRLEISLGSILRNEDVPVSFQGEQQFDDIEYQGEALEFPFPIKVEGTITNNNQVLALKISLFGYIKLQCGSCTEMYDYLVDLSFEAKYKRFEDPEDPDIFLYSKDKIDLSEAILQHILLYLPILRRCKLDCKGLCQTCGTDLNFNKCQC